MTPTVLRPGDRRYPPLLRQLHDPPARLFVRGAGADVLSRSSIAVVGARSCSPYGSQVARRLGREPARGADAEAHRGALDVGGCTVAVLGCGIDRDYPSAHTGLARRIEATGAVVAEYPPGVEPAPWRFPARNRIVAGLCAATVVVEARERSGALITADFALELGRDVYAVPGEITSRLSAGTNELIRQGAAPLVSLDDVLASVGLEPAARAGPTVSGLADALLSMLADAPLEADELVRRSDRPTGEVTAALVELELAGLANAVEGVYRVVA
jgi:DNA processing protein